MRGPINVKSPNNITNWQMRFNSAFKGLREEKYRGCYCVKQEFEKAVNIQTVALGIVTPCSLVSCCGNPL
jgi:hypothetical protein